MTERTYAQKEAPAVQGARSSVRLASPDVDWRLAARSDREAAARSVPRNPVAQIPRWAASPKLRPSQVPARLALHEEVRADMQAGLGGKPFGIRVETDGTAAHSAHPDVLQDGISLAGAAAVPPQIEAPHICHAPTRAEHGVGGRSAPPIVHEVLRTPGAPLEPAVLSEMEPRFGHDLSQIRVHTGQQGRSVSSDPRRARVHGRHSNRPRHGFVSSEDRRR